MWNQLRQLLKHSAIYGLGNLAISLLSFLLVPLYTHYLSVTEFGVYSLIIIVYSLMSLVVDLGLSSSVARYYFDDAKERNPEDLSRFRRRLLSTAFGVTAVSSAALAVAGYMAAGWVARSLFGSSDFEVHLRIIAITLLCYGLGTAPMIYLRITERSLAYSVITCCQVSLFLAFNIIFLVKLSAGVVGIFYSLLASTAVYALMGIAAIARDLRAEFDARLTGQLFKFGLPFLPVMLLKWVIDFSDRYLLDHYASISAVGVYSLGYKFGQGMAFVVTAFTLGWVPIRFKMLSLADPRVVYGRVATLYIAVAGFIWLALSVFSHEIIMLTAPAAFRQAAVFIPPVALSYLLYGLFVLSVTGAGVAKRTAGLPLVMLAAAVLNIGLNLVLIPRVGAMGAAFSTLAAYSAMVAAGLYVSERVYPIAYQYRQCAILMGGMIVLAAPATVLPEGTPIVTIPVKLVVLAAYGGVVAISGALTRSEWNRVAGILSAYAPGFLKGRMAAGRHHSRVTTDETRAAGETQVARETPAGTANAEVSRI